MKALKWLAASAVSLTSVLPAVSLPLQAQTEEGIFPVLEDAYVRKDRSGTTGNYENITKAHGAQYDGKGLKVLNAKENGSTRIIPMMKFALPDAQEIAASNWNQFDLVFHVFKNADPGNCPQTYHFYYTTDTDWDETTVTWSTKPASVDKGTDNLLFDFTFEKDDPWEFKPEEDKIVRQDITQAVMNLAEEGVEEITIFAAAEESKNTSLMFHAKESSLSSSYIEASHAEYSAASLQELADQASALQQKDYTADSWAVLQQALENAEALLKMDNPQESLLAAAANALRSAINGLVSALDPGDPANLAYGKPTRSNLSKKQTARVNDGDVSTAWQALFYPSYVDIDLMEEYALDDVQLYFPQGKNVRYTLYGSQDGRNYTRLAAKENDEKAAAAPFVHELDKPAVRILRVYAEYTEGEDSAWLSEVKVHGEPTSQDSYAKRDGTLQQILDVKDWSETEYAAPVTEEETIENVYGIIGRILGDEYRDWFTFELADQNAEKDWFEISEKNGKTHIRGNEGLSLTRGLNEYFKKYLNVNVSEQTIQIPDALVRVPVSAPVYKETDCAVRYAFNYCTISYTFAFFGEEEWQRENDWLALSGANVVLDLAGQEAVWIQFLMNFGYTFDDAKDWLTGPAYYAWQFMDNMETFGGPVPDGYVKDRLDMARANQRWKNSLGMQTVIQGYAGMVPTNFNEFQPDVQLIEQGSWNGFSRPSMTATDTALYDEYAALFYQAQEFALGNRNHYYAVDPFHEDGKRPAGLGDETISREVLESMTAHDQDAVWVVQGWQSNPTNALLKGMEGYRDQHVLIVDLIKYPIADWTKYDRTSYGSTKLDAKEFNGTPWSWCLLASFGGNPSMHGQMQAMADSIMTARKNTDHMAGLGIISESSFDNPVMYDLVFDLAWEDETFDLDTWLGSYTERRYGTSDANLKRAWRLMKDTLYDYGVRFTSEVFGTKNKTPQSYGKQTILYGAENLEKVIELMLKDYEALCGKETYRYDLTEMMRQHVSNYAVLTCNSVLDAISAKDLDAFRTAKEKFLNAFDVLAQVQSTQKDQLGGEWIGKAEDRAAGYDDFARDSFVMNAKSLITSWGSRSGHRSLKDYGWRNYEGIFQDVYQSAWTDYLNRVEQNLESGASLNNLSVSDYFDRYWKWNMAEQDYTREPITDPAAYFEIVQRVLNECSVQGAKDENAGNLAIPALISGKNTGSQDLSAVKDGKTDTALQIDAEKEDASITLNLIGQFALSSIDILGEYNGQENLQLAISQNGSSWQDVSVLFQEAGWKADGLSGTWQFVRLSVPKGASLNLAELRVYGDRVLPDLSQLQQLIDTAESLFYPASSEAAVKEFTLCLQEAKQAIARQAAPDETDSCYWALYDAICQLDLSEEYNAAKGKPVTAHNDPSGNSARLTDGDLSTKWDAGRLSATGKPYETTITPGWAMVDLGGLMEISSITTVFASQQWHHYSISLSANGEDWTCIKTKTDNSLPVSGGDLVQTNHAAARYVRLDLSDTEVGSDGKRIPVGVSELIVMAKDYFPNLDALSRLISSTADLQEDVYTPQSWSLLQTALDHAQNVMNSEVPLPEDIEAARAALQQAITDLTLKADKTLLMMAVSHADQLISDNALDGVNGLVISLFENALADGKVVLANPNASQDQANGAWSTLCRAIHMLEFRSDFSLLDVLIARAQPIDPDTIADEAARAELEAALQQALEVRQSQTALTEGSIGQAQERLQNALDNLVFAEFNTSLLEYLISEVIQIDLDQYAEEGKQAFEDALLMAKAAAENPLSQHQIDEAVISLNSAWLNLRLLPDESLLASLQAFAGYVAQADLSALEAQRKESIKAFAALVQAKLDAGTYTQLEAEKDLETAKAMMSELEKARIGRTDLNGSQTVTSKSVSVKTSSSSHWTLFAALSAAAASVCMFGKRKGRKD